jgi:hypothetical protein
MVDITINPADLRRIDQAMRAVISTGRVSAEKAVRTCGWAFSRSAAKICKPGDERRRVISNPNLAELSEYPRLVEVYGQARTPRAQWVREPAGKDYGRIERRGLARASWHWTMRRCGRGEKKENRHLAREVARRVTVRMSGGHSPGLMIQNRLSYILDAFPNVVTESIRKGMLAFVATYNREAAHRLRKEWA